MKLKLKFIVRLGNFEIEEKWDVEKKPSSFYLRRREKWESYWL